MNMSSDEEKKAKILLWGTQLVLNNMWYFLDSVIIRGKEYRVSPLKDALKINNCVKYDKNKITIIADFKLIPKDPELTNNRYTDFVSFKLVINPPFDIEDISEASLSTKKERCKSELRFKHRALVPFDFTTKDKDGRPSSSTVDIFENYADLHN